MVDYLVKHHPDINSKNKKNETALHHAVHCGSLEMVKNFVENGAKVTSDEHHGKDTVLYWTCNDGNVLIVEYLLRHGAQRDINDYDHLGRSVLHHAVHIGSMGMVENLVENGAKVTSDEHHGEDTVLYWACQKENQSIVEYLLRHGVQRDINDYDHLGRSLLKNACYQGRSALVRTLLKFSVDIWKEVELTCGNEETTQILNIELKKSVKHQEKIQRLEAIDKKMLAKVIRVDCSDKILILLRFPPLIQKNFNESRLSMYN